MTNLFMLGQNTLAFQHHYICEQVEAGDIHYATSPLMTTLLIASPNRSYTEISRAYNSYGDV